MKEELSRFAQIVGDDALRVLSQKTVCVVGLGGVGGYVVEALARSGIGRFILVDFDTVDLSNINRQLIALHSTVGRKKIDVWKERIIDINPCCQVITYDLFYQEEQQDFLFQEKIDYLVDAIDSIRSKKSLIRFCLESCIPFVSCMGTGNKLDPSQLELTVLAKTSYDPIARILRKWVKEEQITQKIPVLYSKEQPLESKGRVPGSSAFVPSSAGLLIASKVVNDFLSK